MHLACRSLVVAVLALVATGSLARPSFGKKVPRPISIPDRSLTQRERAILQEVARVRHQLEAPQDAKLIRDAAWAISALGRYTSPEGVAAKDGILKDLVARGLLRYPERPGLIYRRNQGTYGLAYYVAWDNRTVFLVFPGTSGSLAQKTIFAAAVPNPFNGSHTGAGVAQATVRAEIKRWVEAAGAKRKRLIIVGHSMGGMLAGVTAWALMNQGVPVHALVTFGSPRYGDANFEKSFEDLARRKGVKAYSVENFYDPQQKPHTPFTQKRVGRNIDFIFRQDAQSLVNRDPHDWRGYYEYAQLMYDRILRPGRLR
jgi:hypothetical protein